MKHPDIIKRKIRMLKEAHLDLPKEAKNKRYILEKVIDELEWVLK